MSDTTRIEPTLEPIVPEPSGDTPKADAGTAGPASSNEGLPPHLVFDDAALAQAKADLAALQAKNTELQEQFLRSQAEMQNTRRRADDEIAKARKFAVESFAESMLAVVDSLEAGLAIKEAKIEQIREGAEITLRQLKGALERNKVLEINPAAGARFDPHQHQAISVVPLPPDSTQEANTVVSVLQKGYLIADRVLRPALVTVAGSK